MSEPNELCYLSATQALQLFRERKLSPLELMDAVIARAEQVEPRVNALSARFFDQARDAARAAEEAYAREDGVARPLEGLPLAVKDDTSIKGQATTHGSLIFKDNIDDHTNPSVERLIGAGGIVHARALCPEFVWPWSCTGRICGTTRNPWNLDITCGASSGGSAAALAAGTTVLATGTDSAGSIRMPAGMCGIVGYKPPYGRNPNSPNFSFDFFNHIGPMTRTVGDCALMQNVMSGPHRADHASVRQKVSISAVESSVRELRIAWSLDLDNYAVDPDVRRNARDTIARLEALGAKVEEVATPWASAAIEAAGHYGPHIYADWFRKAVDEHPDLVCDYTKVFADKCEQVTAAQHHACYLEAGKAWQEFSRVFERYDAFICPTVATTRAHAEIMPWDADIVIEGRSVSADGAWVMTKLFNMFSRCPVLAVPSGRGDNGVPTSVQVVADTFEDETVFRIGLALEADGAWYADAKTRPGL